MQIQTVSAEPNGSGASTNAPIAVNREALYKIKSREPQRGSAFRFPKLECPFCHIRAE